MSDYLDRLETELVRVGFRERRRRPAPLRLAGGAALVAAVVLAILIVVLESEPAAERAVRPATTPVPDTSAGLPGPPAGLGRHRIGVVNGTTITGIAGLLVTQLREAGWRVSDPGNAIRQDVQNSIVVYGKPELAPIAGKVADRLGLPLSQTTGDPTSAARILVAPADPLVGSDGVTIVIGADRRPTSPRPPG